MQLGVTAVERGKNSDGTWPWLKRVKLAALVLVIASLPCLMGIFYVDMRIYWIVPVLALIFWILIRPRMAIGTKKVIAILLSVSLMLVAADTVLRPIYFIRQIFYYRPHEMFNHRWPPFSNLARYETEVSFEGEIFGDLAVMMGMGEHSERRRVSFESDELGFRNKPGACKRQNDMILLGDSFGAGVGISQDRTWSALFEKNYGLLTYNLSFPGSPWSELMNLKLELKNINTRKGALLLWALFAGNDLDDIFGEDTDLPELSGPLEQARVWWSTFRKRSILRRAFKSIEASMKPVEQAAVTVRDLPRGGKMFFWPPYMARMNQTSEEVESHENFGRLKAVFETMKEFSRTRDLQVVVVSLPSKPEIYPWILENGKPWPEKGQTSGFSEAVRGLCLENHFPFLDLKPDFIEEARKLYDEKGEFLWWRDDTHWNEHGNEAAARIVYEKLIHPLQEGVKEKP
jgi:hypothetical protein